MKYLALAFLIAVTTLACKKTEDAPAKQQPAAATAGPDYVRILASHANPKPKDPVTIEIKGWKIVKADFDPAKVEGGTAVLELDLASLVSSSTKRDDHLKSEDYLDVDSFAIATITIGNVVKAGASAYTADAAIAIHGVEKTLPVTFEVIETLPDGIRVRGEHVFSRHDFAIGAAEGLEDSAGDTQTIQLQLTLRKT